VLAGLPRTSRALILTGPLFAPTALAAPFAVAFQGALGLSPAQIGALGGAATGLGFVFLLVGGQAARRWGRLRAMTVFDALGFVLPALLLALARTPAELVAAALLGATAQGAQAGFQGLLLADARPHLRPRAAALERLLLMLPSLAMPLLAAVLVAQWGMVPAVRAMYAASAASVAGMVAARWWLLQGSAPPAAASQPGLRDLADAARALRATGLAPVLAASAALAFAGGLNVLAQLRVLDVLRIEAWWLGPLGFATLAADLGASALAVRAGRGLAWGLAGAIAASSGAVLFVAARDPALLIASAATLGASGAWWGLGLTAMLHDAVPEPQRDRAVVAQLGARALAALAGQAMAGVLFVFDPAAPWWVAAVVALVAIPLVAQGRRAVRDRPERPAG
jgi:MFS family permease